LSDFFSGKFYLCGNTSAAVNDEFGWHCFPFFMSS
jgi:hypothetical protein